VHQQEHVLALKPKGYLGPPFSVQVIACKGLGVFFGKRFHTYLTKERAGFL